jgi:hypothetical protein
MMGERPAMGVVVIRDDKQETIGLTLKADATSEHEWGIKGLQAAFGIEQYAITDKPYGLERHFATVVPGPTCCQFFFQGDSCVLMMLPRLDHASPKAVTFAVGSFLAQAKRIPAQFYAEWGEAGFAVYEPAGGTILLDIYAAIQRKDLAVWVGHSVAPVSEGGGLNIVIASHIPSDKAAESALAGRERAERERAWIAARGTLLEDLKAAGKGYFYLGDPKFIRGELRVWLNPMQQDDNNYGWFTVAELQQWVRNEGPIVQLRKRR